MQIIKGRKTGKSIEIQEMPTSALMLLPPPEDVCQECAREHPQEWPHDKQSLYYQMKFQMEHGRGATWADAVAHCPDEIKALWMKELQKLGVEVQK